MSNTKNRVPNDTEQKSDKDRVLSSNERNCLVDSLKRHLGAPDDQPQAGIDSQADFCTSEIFPVYKFGWLLLFPRGQAPDSGSRLKLESSQFEIVNAPAVWRYPALAALLVLVILSAVLLLPQPAAEQYSILGLVTDSRDGNALQGASVSIPDLDLRITADSHGRFQVADLAPGSYVVEAQSDGFFSGFATVTLEDRPEMLVLEMAPVILDSLEPGPSESMPDETGTLHYGKIRIKSNIKEAEILLNGKTLGTGSHTFNKIKPGKHVLTVTAPTYTEYVTEIEVAAGLTSEVIAILEPFSEPQIVELRASDYLRIGESLYAAGAGLEAIGNYTLAIARDPQSAEAFRRRGEANLSLSNQLAAIADFRQAGELFSQSGNYNRAIAAYDQILELSPGAVQIYQLRGWVQIWAGGTQAGLLDLEKALSLDDDNWRARFQLGKALCLTGDYKHAEKHLKKIRKYGEEQPQILAFLALSYLGRDKTGDAVKYYIKYSELATPGSDRQVANLSDWITLTTLAAQER
jgi:hypothetical protein